MSENVKVSIDREEILKAIRYDCVTFFSVYMGEKLTFEVPEFHIEIWNELLRYLELVRNPKVLTGVLKKLFCVPRGHAKTTLTKLAVVLFLRYSPFSFGVYASNTIAVAVAAIKDILAYFENPLDDAIYGEKVWPNHPGRWVERNNDSLGLYIFWIQTPEYGNKRCIMKAMGVDTQIRGTNIDDTRPQFAVADDVEGNDTAGTKTSQKRIDQWFFGAFMQALDKRALLVMLGNMISETTIICRLSKEADWNPTVFGSIVRDKKTGELRPLWPGLHTLKGLITEYMSYRRNAVGHIWAYEKMNLTSESVFGIELENAVLIPMPNPDMVLGGCLVLDPAFGIQGYSDESSITIHARLKSVYYGHEVPHVIGHVTRKMTEDQILDELIGLSTYWGISTWCIEAISAQRLLIPYFKTAMKLRNMNPDSILMLPIVTSKQSKSSRIISMRGAVANGTYGLVDSLGELIDKLGSFDPEKPPAHDDLIDSASMGIIAWDNYGTVIDDRGVQKIAHALWNHSHGARSLSQIQVSPM